MPDEGPFPPFPAALEAMERTARELNRYPDGGAYRGRARSSRRQFDVEFEHVTVGSGADGVIDCVSQAFPRLGRRDRLRLAVVPELRDRRGRSSARIPVRAPTSANGTYDLDALLDAITPRTKVVYVCNPNNPTGT